MRARTELAIAAGVVAVLLVAAVEAARRRGGAVDPDTRASSFLYGPNGLSALASIYERAGLDVRRYRQRPSLAEREIPEQSTIVLALPGNFASDEANTYLALTRPERGAHLVLAGWTTRDVMQCLGYSVSVRVLDTVRVAAPEGVNRGTSDAYASAVLTRPRDDLQAVDPTDPDEFTDSTNMVFCPTFGAIDTLLQGDRGEVLAVTAPRDSGNGRVTLIADAGLLSNGTLRKADVALHFAATLPRTTNPVVFAEFHQGFGPGSSLMRVSIDWMRRTPWGWAILQLSIAGLLAFLAGAVRFGVPATIPRVRRSALEHVRALANALSAANGHDTAIGLLVRGLQRRLSARTGRPAALGRGADWRQWVSQLKGRTPDPRTRALCEKLERYAEPGQSNAAVRTAANVVEDVWEALAR